MGHKNRAKQLNRDSRQSALTGGRPPARQWHIHRRGIWRAILFAFGSLAVVSVALVYLRSAVPVSVSAVLSSSGNAQFTYATRQQDTYSPACGCMADKSERWRGITFAARRLQVANLSEAKRTAFWVMAAEPDKLDWSPTLFRPRIRLIRMAVDGATALTTQDIMGPTRANGVMVIDDATLAEGDVAALITSQPIDVMLPGSYPVAAYIPVENSRVSITQRESTFPTDRDAPLIREEYPPSRNRIEHVGNMITGAEMAYPMMDFVGTQTILVTEDPSAKFIFADQIYSLNGACAPGRRTVTAIVVNSPFSTRISAMPFGENVNNVPASSPELEPMRSKFTQADGPARPLETGEEVVLVGAGAVDLPTDVAPRKRGKLEVTILESLTPSDYSRLEQSLKKSDTVWAYDIRSRVQELDHHGEDFRYPPIPPVGGFNVFGLLAQLTLHVKSGRIMIGATTVPIDAPSVVEFEEILAFTPKRNVVPIPLVVNGQEQALDFSVEATSKLSVNGAPVTMQVDRKRTIIEIVVALMAVIQATAAVAAVWPRQKA